MVRKISFTKMHGAGNDYIYVNTMEQKVPNPAEAAIAWSDRHKGIGSDGLVLIGKSPVPEADFTMHIYNADGSEAMMCGNASRCIGKYLYDRNFTTKTSIRLLTLSGIKVLHLHLLPEGVVGSVTVDMGEPVLENESQFIPHHGLDKGIFVSMGNPHYVLFTDDVDQVFARIEDDENILPPEGRSVARIRTRVWERGSGITMACGTGACATAVAAALTGKSGRTSHIVMDGGTLSIEWKEADNHVYMTGSAEFVFDGEIEIDSKL